MTAILPAALKHWLERKQRLHQQAVDEYCFNLRAALEKDTERRIRKLNARSITISLDQAQLSGATQVRGLSLERESLPGVKLEERVVLVEAESKRHLARGFVLAIGPETVKVKLDKKLQLESAEELIKFELAFHKGRLLERVDRIGQALDKLKSNACSPNLQKCLLGDYDDLTNVLYTKSRLMVHPDLEPAPKGFQLLAIEQAMKRRVALIEGVAGSGKTLVAANIACSMCSLRKRKILLCSPCPSSISKLVNIIGAAKNINLVQLGDVSPSLPRAGHNFAASGSESCLLETLVEESIFQMALSRSASRLQIADDPFELQKRAQRALKNCSKWLRRKVERDILAAADIVVCSLFQAGNKCLKNVPFDMLIIDDAHLASEADCLIAMMAKGLKQVTLLSELRREIRLARSSLSIAVSSKPRRGNSIKSERSALRRGNSLVSTRRPPKGKGMLIRRLSSERYSRDSDIRQVKQSGQKKQTATTLGGLFERLLALGLSSVALKNQFRMHETLADFPKYQFYMSRLKTDPEANQQLTSKIIDEANASVGNDEAGNNRFSWLPNKGCLTAIFNTEAINDITLDIINKLVRENIDTSRIGIITNTQFGIRMPDVPEGLEVGTIENYLGLERDFIVLACFNNANKAIRSKDEASSRGLDDDSWLDDGLFEINCNYLQNNNSLNIALTRARMGLIIVANLSDILKDISGEENSQSGEVDKPQKQVVENKSFCKSWLGLVKYYQTNKLIV